MVEAGCLQNWLTDNQCASADVYYCKSALHLESYNSFRNECPDIFIAIILDRCLF